MAWLFAGQGDWRAGLAPGARSRSPLGADGPRRHTQRAGNWSAQLTGGDASGGPNPGQILRQFAPVVTVAVAAVHGDRNAGRNWNKPSPCSLRTAGSIADPIQRIWADERDETALTEGLDAYSALIVREILHRL